MKSIEFEGTKVNLIIQTVTKLIFHNRQLPYPYMVSNSSIQASGKMFV
jgi:hypothetical protein